MAKGYWIIFYRSVSNPDALAEYGRLAGPAILAGRGAGRTAPGGVTCRTALHRR
jgi:hypothetical protein